MLKSKIKAAYEAFKDPWLVGEAKSMRETVMGLAGNEFALLFSVFAPNNRLIPKVLKVTYEERQRIRKLLGMAPFSGSGDDSIRHSDGDLHVCVECHYKFKSFEELRNHYCDE
jgi:hypothetical protein